MAKDYFTVEIQVTNGETLQSISAQDIRDDAIIAFHQGMASMRTAVKNGTLDEATGMVLNRWGSVEEPYHEYVVKEQTEVLEEQE